MVQPHHAAGSASILPQLTVTPNPASAWTAISYDLPATNQGQHIVIRDISGREVEHFIALGVHGQVVWDTRHVAPGVYSAELLNNMAILGSQKIVIQP